MAGSPKVGRIESVRIDPQDPSRMEIDFSVESKIPVKTNTHVRIAALSALGDNHLELVLIPSPRLLRVPGGDPAGGAVH